MAYPLGGLLAIRDFREEAAAKKVRAAEAQLRTAQENQIKKEEELKSYKKWHLEEVERRYQAIMGQAMTVVELDKFKTGLAALEDQELAKAEDCRLAEKAVDLAREGIQKARDFWLNADKARQKILYHRKEWQSQQDREAAYQEDMEMEEFRPVLFTAAD
jgi:type III secretion protein O